MTPAARGPGSVTAATTPWTARTMVPAGPPAETAARRASRASHAYRRGRFSQGRRTRSPRRRPGLTCEVAPGRCQIVPGAGGGDLAAGEDDDPVGLGQGRAFRGGADHGCPPLAERCPQLDLGSGVEGAGD